ncbi:hypothetical protein BDK92_2616 [Micromonospora pisi]|uniref:Rv3660c-like CheY-like N-terminal domain-containing protein n=1 Tax=Micromonospora pisi TaxID=589240 RepID=A0A495JHS1_9ACTN|nr:hypothetical protein [Micromonospora pisi]RKR88305.1 hypothetical protein BDK92_2616 [Micromonospora pisi]
MSTVLVVTGDPSIREHLHAYADRVGVHLTDHTTVTAAKTHWAGANLVLLGADLLSTQKLASMPTTPELIIVSADRSDFSPFSAAAGIGAAYVAVVPDADRWLTEQLRRAGGDAVDRLRAAGFRIGFAHRVAAADTGCLLSYDLSDQRYDDEQALYVSLEKVARGDCRAGQSTTVDRSNYRSLHRAHPGLWTDLVFSNVTALGAFVADLPPEVVDVLCWLKESYPLFDEHDHSALEDEDIDASWEQWVSADVFAMLGERAQEVWSALDAVTVRRLWWDTVTGLGYRPEHNGLHVTWDYTRLVPAFAARLMAEFRRGWRHDDRYQIVPGYRGWRAYEPVYAVFTADEQELIGIGFTRFQAQVHAWQHQTARRSELLSEGEITCVVS